MFKHTVRFEDFDGNSCEKTLHFHLSKAEILRMEISSPDGLEKKFKEIAESGDRVKILEAFEWIIGLSYGERLPDSQRFAKSPESLDSFKQSPAYDEFLMDLLTKDNVAEAFVKGIIPNSASIGVAVPNADN